MCVSPAACTTVRTWSLVAVLFCSQAPAQETEVSIAATDWEPYTSATMDGGGLLLEIATEAFSRAGIHARLEFMPWKRALDSSKAGLYDGLAGASHTRERERFFHYPQYHFVSKLMLFARREEKEREYETLNDLCPASVGVLRGSFIVDMLKSAPCLELDLADDVTTNVRKLLRGRIDFLAESEASVRHYVRKEMPHKAGSLGTVVPPLADDPVYVVFSKRHANYAGLGQAYDSGVESMRADGTLAAILGKYGLASDR